MIKDIDFEKVTSLALKDVKVFLEMFGSEDFFRQDMELNKGYLKTSNALRYLLQRFIPDLLIYSFEENEVPGFASWLIRTDQGRGGIALYTSQMVSWCETAAFHRALPVPAQKIRSIVHELGHIRANPHILINTPRPQTGKVRAQYATELEEEMAWVYAATFLGLILGDYSYWARKNHHRDDAPKFFI